MGEAPGAKICQVCGQDCSNKKRMKDPQGRYICQECIDKKQAAKAASPPKPPAAPVPKQGEPNIMANLIEDSISKAAVSCPGCRRPFKPDSVICTYCGFNRQTASMVQTQVKEAEIIVDKSSKKTMRRRSFNPAVAVLIALLVFGGLLAGCMAEPMLILPTIVLVALYQLAIMLLVTVNAFQDGDGGWGILGIVSFFFNCAWLGMIYYIWAVTEREYLRSLWLIGLISYIAVIVLYAVNQDELMSALGQTHVKGGP